MLTKILNAPLGIESGWSSSNVIIIYKAVSLSSSFSYNFTCNGWFSHI
jgi:hypothetical protein